MCFSELRDTSEILPALRLYADQTRRNVTDASVLPTPPDNTSTTAQLKDETDGNPESLNHNDKSKENDLNIKNT